VSPYNWIVTYAIYFQKPKTRIKAHPASLYGTKRIIFGASPEKLKKFIILKNLFEDELMQHYYNFPLTKVN